MNHAELVEAIGAAADARGYWWHAENDARQASGRPGWVDVVVLAPGGAVFIEAKSEGGTRTPAQRAAAHRIRAAGLRYLLCFPRDLGPGGRLAQVLDAIATRAGGP